MTKWLVLLLCLVMTFAVAQDPLTEAPADQTWEEAVGEQNIDTMYPDNLLVDLKDLAVSNSFDTAKIEELLGEPLGAGLLGQLATDGEPQDTPPSAPVWNWNNAPTPVMEDVTQPVYEDVLDDDGNVVGQEQVGTEVVGQTQVGWNYSGATGEWETDEWDIAARNWDPNAKDVNMGSTYSTGNMASLFNEASNVIDGVDEAFADLSGNAKDAAIADFHADLQSMIDFYAADMAADNAAMVYTDGDTAQPITNQNYLDDLQELKRYYENEAGNIAFLENNAAENNDDSQDASKSFDPRSYLDKSVTDRVSKQAVKLDLLFKGARGNFESGYLGGGIDGYSISSLSEKFRNSFASYGTIDQDLEWFNDTWGAYETSVQDGSIDGTYNDAESYKRQLAQSDWGKSYAVNAYGEIVQDDPNTEENEYTSLEGVGFDSSITHTYTVQTGRFNNRSWGYRDGTVTNAKITMNNKTYQLTQSYFTSPIVLDMDGDGNLEASQGQWLPGHQFKEGTIVKEFDINGDGFLEMVEWVGPNDGLLIRYDENADLSANQLYGTAGGWGHGFEKMRYEDLNKDGVLSGSELEGLSVWQDKNSNAQLDEGELTSVQELGITEIKTSHTKLKSSFVRNGESHTSWDWHPLTFNVRRVK